MKRILLVLLVAWIGADSALTAIAEEQPLPSSPITNHWGKVAPVVVDVEHSIVFKGSPGQGYSHQQQLNSRDGKLYATWSLGARDEEGPRQQMVLSTSEDRGQTWSEPAVVAPSRQGKACMSTVVSSGLHVHKDKLIAYYGEWERTPAGLARDGRRTPANEPAVRTNARTEARVSTDGGKTWSEPALTIPRVFNYFPPMQLRDGRLILPGNLTFHFTDDPSGLTGWKRAAVPGIPDDFEDDYFNMQTASRLLKMPNWLNEASVFQTAEGVIHAMIRNELNRALATTQSNDCGVTWSPLHQTAFTDNTCRAQFGRLPDGRCFAMSCPDPKAPMMTRSPMVLATSRDGINFDKHYVLGAEPPHPIRLDGIYKGGRYGYPYLHIVGDNGFVVYSINKEDIGVGRFKLSAIAD